MNTGKDKLLSELSCKSMTGMHGIFYLNDSNNWACGFCYKEMSDRVIEDQKIVEVCGTDGGKEMAQALRIIKKVMV